MDDINKKLEDKYLVTKLEIQKDRLTKEEFYSQPDNTPITPKELCIPEKHDWPIFYMIIEDVPKKKEFDELARQKAIKDIELQSQKLDKQKQELASKLSGLKNNRRYI